MEEQRVQTKVKAEGKAESKASTSIPVPENGEEKTEEIHTNTLEKTAEIASTSPPDNKEKKAHYCSMCWGEDTEYKLLFQCSECNVTYHNECYRGVSMDAVQLEGLQFEENESGLFIDVCIACAAVGKTIKGRTKGGSHHELKVESRPYECCLCSVDDPSLPLPMHPIYDRNNGRQLILERWQGAPAEIPRHRLAWCHTLCAQFIGTYAETGGCVYSCNQDGTYGGYAEDDDDRSIGSEVEEARKSSRMSKPEAGADPIETLSLYGYHHFCIVMMKQWTAYIKAIKKAQTFECLECLASDKKTNIWRMAIPCMCKENQEPKNYQSCHAKLDHECVKAMHVGCAMWGKRINGKQRFPKLRRVYYQHMYGQGDDLCLMYCNEHAKNIRDNGKKHGIEGANWLRFPGASGISPEGSAVPKDADIEIENANDAIESDRDDDDDVSDVGDSDSDSDDDVGVIHSDDSDVEKKRRKKNGKEGKDRTKGTKRKRERAPKKPETVQDRLARKLAKRAKTSSGAASASIGTVGSQRAGNTGTKQSTSLNTTSRKGLPVLPPTNIEEDGVDKAEEEIKKPPPMKKKKPLRLMGLYNGKGVNWNE